MNTPASGERVNGSTKDSSGLGVIGDSVAKLNALLGDSAHNADDSVGPRDAGDPDARSRLVQCMAMRIGDLGLLFSVNAGREVVAPPPVSRIPNTVSWLRGLANVRGSLVPVIDTAVVLGVTRTTGTPPYLLIFGQGEGAIGFIIDGLPRLLDIDTAAVVDDLSAAPSVLTPAIRTAYDHAGRVWYEIDLDVWFDTLAREVAITGADQASSGVPTDQ